MRSRAARSIVEVDVRSGSTMADGRTCAGVGPGAESAIGWRSRVGQGDPMTELRRPASATVGATPVQSGWVAAYPISVS